MSTPTLVSRGLRWLVVVLTAVVGTTAVRASSDAFIVSTSPELLGDVLARHRLALDGALDQHGVYRVRDLEAREPEEVLQDLSQDPAVATASAASGPAPIETPDYPIIDQSTDAILEALRDDVPTPFYGSTVPSGYVSQTATRLVGLADAQFRGTGSGVIVAVIDTGIDPQHRALRQVVLPGFDFTRDVTGTGSELQDLNSNAAAALEQSTDAILEDLHVTFLSASTAAVLDQSTDAILEGGNALPSAFGHGTMVAGLVHLVAPTALIMPLKVFRSDGSSDLFDIVRAVYYAVDHGARVINMSFSMRSRLPELDRAIDYARERGVVVVSSAGNRGERVQVFPAALNDVLGIASTNNLDRRSRFSNYGTAGVDLAAPGEALITTYPGGRYAAAWGTSFSAALVSGSAALLAGLAGSSDNDPTAGVEIVELSLQNAKRIGRSMGKGRIDLRRALAALDWLLDPPQEETTPALTTSPNQ